MSEVVVRLSYTGAVDRFTSQTQELKRLLGDESIVLGEEDTHGESECVSSSSSSGGSSDDEESLEEDNNNDDDDDEGSSGCESSDCSDESSDWDSDLEDLENVLTGKAAPAFAPTMTTVTSVARPIKKNLSSPALMAMNVSIDHDVENVLPGILDLKARMRRTSTSYLQKPEFLTETQPETIENPFASTRPDDHLKSILEGFSAASFPSETWHDYFLQMTDAHIEAHTTEVERAIRSEDFGTMRDMLRRGHTLQTCNKHGESIVHIACRRGSLELIQFLIQEAGVSTQIRDDMGRTPLHDACWTTKPNFQVILELLKVAPELLFIVDHRGATPLAYIPRESWGIWCDFLQEQRIFLRDMVKSLRFDRARYYIKNMVPCLKF